MARNKAGELSMQKPNFEGRNNAEPRMRSYWKDLSKSEKWFLILCIIKVTRASLWISCG